MPYTHRRRRSNESRASLGHRVPSPTTAPIDITTVPPCVCVVGVGFVGESLLREFSHVFPSTIGFDISASRISSLRAQFKATAAASLDRKKDDDHHPPTLTSDERDLSHATHYLIAVPTLLTPARTVNLTHLLSALRTVLTHARPGSAIVIESSVSVGTTRQLLAPYKSLHHCGMSPERVDPGRATPPARSIPKLVSGLTPAALTAIRALYARVYDTVIPVSTPETAEMTKLFENCYRMVNIAYVNEMADAARAHGVDPAEMVAAAATKPYGFAAFEPGLGVGGHCIPVNPFYLFANNPHLPVLEKATASMWQRPARMAKSFHRRASAAAAKHGKQHASPHVLVVGVGFKPGQAVLSCSPGLAFASKLRSLGCQRLCFYDPLVAQDAVGDWMEKLDDGDWTAAYIDDHFDAVAVCVRQPGVEFDVLDKLGKARVQEFR